MGLAVRVIPTLLMRGDQLVKGRQFNAWRSVGHIEQAVRVMASRGVDEMILLDIGATPEGRGPNFERVNKLTGYAFTPITVGGGVRSLEDIRSLLAAGADKVAIGTGARWLVEPAARRFGNQAIVVAIDAVSQPKASKKWGVRVRCGTKTKAKSPLGMAQYLEGRGAGEILLTSIDREGTMQGYDLDLIRAVSQAVSIPVIAHGGCSGPEDMLAAIKAGASAVAAGALFAFTDHTPRSCAEWLAGHGVETRVAA